MRLSSSKIWKKCRLPIDLSTDPSLFFPRLIQWLAVGVGGAPTTHNRLSSWVGCHGPAIICLFFLPTYLPTNVYLQGGGGLCMGCSHSAICIVVQLIISLSYR